MSEIPSGIIGALVSLVLLFAGLAIFILALLLRRMAERNKQLLEQVAGNRTERKEVIRALKEGEGIR